MMLNLIRVFVYPSVSLARVNDLPRKPGIYFARRGLTIQYVGLSKSLHRRWTATGSNEHHHKRTLERMGGVRLHYRLCQLYELRYIEALEIRRFSPPLNDVKPIPANHLNWQIQLQSLPVLVGALAAAIVGLGIVEAIDRGAFGFKEANTDRTGDSPKSLLRER